MGETVRLGEITCPSGQLVVADGGYLGIWSGNRSPAEIHPEMLGIDDPRAAAEVAGSVDFEIVGPDAAEAARSFDHQPGRSRYDIPASVAAGMFDRFGQHCREHGLDAQLEASGDRVPHRQRVRRCAATGGGGFIAFGVPMVAVGGLPPDRELQVEAVRVDYGGRVGSRWQSLRIVVTEARVAHSVPLGDVGVDWARLVFADADGLGSWMHDEPVDGLADVAFWGAATLDAAAAHGAAELGEQGEDGVFGWTGLGLREAVEQVQTLTTWMQADPQRRIKVDFRPHSHHWQVMRAVRASPDEAGMIEVGGARMLFAMTSWGDGWFPVYADRDASGDLVAVRVVLGDDERARRHVEMLDPKAGRPYPMD